MEKMRKEDAKRRRKMYGDVLCRFRSVYSHSTAPAGIVNSSLPTITGGKGSTSDFGFIVLKLKGSFFSNTIGPAVAESTLPPRTVSH